MAALRTVSTATLSVHLARRGISNPFIAGLHPTRPDMRLLGYAYTLRYVPLREDVRDAESAELNAQKRAIESIGPGEVLVIDARGETGAGTIGDILAARAMVRGASGIVTDGGLRDLAAVSRLDIPTYYKAAHPSVLGRLHFPLETNVPIACGGALVMPGDVIVGDEDGVLVLPAALAEQVATTRSRRSRARRGRSSACRPASRCATIYPLSEARREEYEAWARADARPMSSFAADPDAIRGAITPLITPFTAGRRARPRDGRARSSTGSSQQGSHAISVGGSTGEPVSQTRR